MKLNQIIIATMIVLTACGTRLLAPTEDDVISIRDQYPDATLTALNEGKTLYQENCSRCHALHDPADFTDKQWGLLVPDMAKKAQKKGINITGNMQTKISMYLMAVNDQ